MQRVIRLVIAFSLLAVIFTGTSCTHDRSFDSSLDSIVKSYRFSIAGWEWNALFGGDENSDLAEEGETGDEAGDVLEYFAIVERIRGLSYQVEAINNGGMQGDLVWLEDELDRLQEKKTSLEDVVEKTIEKQVREALAGEGILNPVDEYLKINITFPPVNFALERPPHLLVVSPRDSIESMREISLKQDMIIEEMEGIEAGVDELGVSSLVVKLGGYGGAYPTFVTDEANLRFTIDTVVEEWLHQYLIFEPLGFLYLLDVTGISRNYEIATMNETVAGMVSREIGAIVYEKYYQQYEDNSHAGMAEPVFDFNKEMRDIRTAVDELLEQGEIERAEELMETKRQYLASNGYYIRKLNQAYFAFHGAYADKPTSVSPIGVEVRELRDKSDSLKGFLDTASAMTSRQDLIDSLK